MEDPDSERVPVGPVVLMVAGAIGCLGGIALALLSGVAGLAVMLLGFVVGTIGYGLLLRDAHQPPRR
jgi:hypothetical protein